MADVFKGLTIKFGGDTTALSSALKKIQKDATATQRDLKKIQNALKYNPGSQVLMGRSIELMQRKLGDAQKELDALYEAAAKGPGNMSTEAWTELQTKIEIAKSKVKNFTEELSRAYIKMDASNSALGRAGQALQDFSARNDKAAQKLISAGSAMTRGLTVPIVAAGAASVAAAVKIDDSLTGVRKTVDGTAEQYKQLKQAAIDFSKTNAVSASQVLDIQALGGQLGFAIDELQEFSEVVSGLGVSTDMSFEQAATEMAQFANITKMSHADVSRYGSAIVDLGNNFATTESAISAMAMRLAASGTQVGMTQADILGLATALSSMGVEAEAGGTAISTIMAQIDKDVATGSADMETWASTANMSASEFAAAWSSNPVQALSAVLSGMEEATNAGGNMSLMLDELGISSLRQTDVMKRLAGNSELVGRAVESANSAWKGNTALQREVDNRNQSLASQFEMLKNRIIAIADSFGGPLATALLDILDAAEPLFQAIADGARTFADMDKQSQQMILSAVGLVAALGPLTTGLGKLVTASKGIGEALSGIAQFFAKIGGAGKQAGQGINAAAKATEKMNKSASMSATALGGLKAGLAGLGIATVVYMVSRFSGEMQKSITHTKNMATASRGLSDAIDALNNTTVSATDGAKAYGVTIGTLTERSREAAQSQADFYSSLKDVFAEAGSRVATLDSYRDVIEELYGRTDLTAAEQAKLSAALQQVGDQTGKTLEMVQDSEGAYIAMGDGVAYAKDQILDLIDAQKMQIKAEAYAGKLTDAFANQEQRASDLRQAIQGLGEAEKYLESIRSDTTMGADERAQAEELALETISKARSTLNEAANSYSNAGNAVKALSDNYALLQRASKQGADSLEYVVANNAYLMNAFSESNQSALDFTQTLADAGVSAKDFGDLSVEAVSKIAENYDGSFLSIAEILAEHSVSMNDAAMATYNAFQKMQEDADLAIANINGAFVGFKGGKDEFVKAVAEAGFSVEQFAKLTPEQIGTVARAMESGTQDWQAIMEGFVSSQNENGQQIGANLLSGLDASLATADTTLATHLTAMDANAAAVAGMPQTTQVFNEATGQMTTVASDMVYKTNEQFARLGPETSATIASGGEQINTAVHSVADGIPAVFDGVAAQVGASGAAVGPAYGNAMAGGAGAAQAGGQALVSAALSSVGSGAGQFSQAGQQGSNDYAVGILSGQGTASANAQALVTAAIDALLQGVQQAQKAGDDSGAGYADNIGKKSGEARSAGNSLGSSAVDAMLAYVSKARSAGSQVGSAFASALSAAASAAHISMPSLPATAPISAAPSLSRPVMPVPAAAQGIMPIAADDLRASIASTVGRVYEQTQRAISRQEKASASERKSDSSGLTERDVAKIVSAMRDQFAFTANFTVDGKQLAIVTATANDQAIGNLRTRKSR